MRKDVHIRSVVELERLALEEGLDDSVKVCVGWSVGIGQGWRGRRTGVNGFVRVRSPDSVEVDFVHVARVHAQRRVDLLSSISSVFSRKEGKERTMWSE